MRLIQNTWIRWYILVGIIVGINFKSYTRKQNL